MFFIKPRVSGYPMISNFGYPVPELPDFAHPYNKCLKKQSNVLKKMAGQFNSSGSKL